MDRLLGQARDWVWSTAGQHLHIVWKQDVTSWELVVTGIGMEAFKNLSGAAWDLGQIIAHESIVIVKVTTGEKLSDNEAACTFDVGERRGNPTAVVVLNQSREGWLKRFPDTTGEGSGYDSVPEQMTWSAAPQEWPHLTPAAGCRLRRQLAARRIGCSSGRPTCRCPNRSVSVGRRIRRMIGA